MMKTLLRAGLNAFFACIAMFVAVVTYQYCFAVSVFGFVLAGTVPGGLVLVGMSSAQRKAQNLSLGTLIVQNIISAIMALLFLAALAMPASWLQ